MKKAMNYRFPSIITYIVGMFFILIHFNTFAAKPIEGKVIDAKSNKPIANVHINIVGKNISTISDVNGNFSIPLPENNKEVKICIYTKGYQPKMYRVEDLKKNYVKTSTLVPQEELLFEMQPIPLSIINEDSPKSNRYNLNAGWIY